jgi:uncharacterized protein (TIGR04222 family)
MNPLELSGPSFLGLFIVLTVVATLGAMAMQRIISPLLSRAHAKPDDLTPIEIAYLADGRDGALRSGIATVGHRVRVLHRTKERTLRTDVPVTKDDGSFESRLHALMAEEPRDIGALRLYAGPMLEQMKQRLVSVGLLESDANRKMLGMLPASLIALVVLLGVLKVAIGVQRDKPVMLLCILIALACVVALVFVDRAPNRTPAGSTLIDSLRNRHAALEATARSRFSALTSSEVTLAVALFGLSILQGTPLAALALTISPPVAAADGSGSSSCGGGSCGGCGGCGS